MLGRSSTWAGAVQARDSQKKQEDGTCPNCVHYINIASQLQDRTRQAETKARELNTVTADAVNLMGGLVSVIRAARRIWEDSKP